jgi:hypothetical protein
MNRLVYRLTAIASLWLCASGCSNGKVFTQAQKAEKRGRPEVAYEEYCKAAVDHHGSGAVAAGLSRTREAAAAFWEKRALIAMDEHRYVDAWRMLMRVLEIQPDEDSSADLIRRLESEHADALADPREEYLRRGGVSLTPSLRQEIALAGTATRTEDNRVASGSSVQPETVNPDAVARTDVPTPATMTQVNAEPTNPTGTELQSSHEFMAVTRQPWAGSKQVDELRIVDAASGARRGDAPSQAALRSLNSEVSKSKKGGSTGQPPDGLPADRRTDRRRAGEFEMVCTLSKRDSRYCRTVKILDGVELRLRETDDDPDVDMDVFKGTKRLKKLRGMEIGESQTFGSKGGRLYRLTILSIHDPSKTVRVGIRPA